jgi:hypothetical protein
VEEMQKLLEGLNAGAIFDPSRARLTRLSDQQISVSKVAHKARVKGSILQISISAENFSAIFSPSNFGQLSTQNQHT